jgi:hypothetical protein
VAECPKLGPSYSPDWAYDKGAFCHVGHRMWQNAPNQVTAITDPDGSTATFS